MSKRIHVVKTGMIHTVPDNRVDNYRSLDYIILDDELGIAATNPPAPSQLCINIQRTHSAITKDVYIAILSKTDSYIVALLDSIFKTNPGMDPKQIIVIDDGISENTRAKYPVIWIPGIKPFSFSQNANLALRAARLKKKDLWLCNDDLLFVSNDPLNKLRKIAEGIKKLGVLSPVVRGGGVGNPAQWEENTKELTEETKSILCFVSVYIPFSAIVEIGLLDEDFGSFGYGYDDNEYCLRARRAGLKLMITPEVIVHHVGDGTRNFSGTFGKDPKLSAKIWKNKQIFERKFPKQLDNTV